MRIVCSEKNWKRKINLKLEIQSSLNQQMAKPKNKHELLFCAFATWTVRKWEGRREPHPYGRRKGKGKLQAKMRRKQSISPNIQFLSNYVSTVRKLKRFIRVEKVFGANFSPCRVSLALNGLHLVQCYCWCVRVCLGIFTRLWKCADSGCYGGRGRRRRRYCSNTDFRFKDAYSCLEIYSEPLTFLLVLSLILSICFLSECVFFHFISCSCWSMVLLRVLCCFAHYFYLLSVHSMWSCSL